MELYDKIIRIIDYNLIYCLTPMILILFLIEKVYKNKYPTKTALKVIKWIILGYTLITFIHFIVSISLYPDEYAFRNRATGPYKLFYWLMLFCSIILPFTLFIKKLSNKYWYVMLVAFCIKIGVYFEYYVILTTSIHRNYLPNKFPTPIFDWIYTLSIITLQAFIIVVVILTFLKLISKKLEGAGRDSSLHSE